MADEVTEWIDPDGVTTTLDVEWAAKGRFMPGIEFEADGVPGQPGQYFRSVRHGTHEMVLPIQLTAPTPGELRTTMRNLVARMDPTRGASRLRVTSPLGDQREIVCRYAGGLEMEETLDDNSGWGYQRAAVSLLSHDPYWYDVSPNGITLAVDPNVPSFFPFFPLKLTASELALDTTVDNTGDVDTWPVWTIAGPGGVIKLTNLTTGKVIDFPSAVLAAGQFLTIDTRPGRKTITFDDGTNGFGLTTTTSSLWPLVRGINAVRLEMSGVDHTVSSLQLSYHRRYLSP